MTPFIKFLESAASAIDHVDDYSGGSAETVKLTADVDYYMIQEVAFVFVFDDAAPDITKFLADTALTNGFSLKLYDADDAVLADLCSGEPIKTTAALYMRATSPVILTAFAGDKQHGRAIIRFDEPLIIRRGCYLGVDFSDDLSSVADSLHIVAQGVAKDG